MEKIIKFFETGLAIKKNNKELDKNFFNSAEYEIYKLKSILRNYNIFRYYRKISKFEKGDKKTIVFFQHISLKQ